MKTDDGDRSVDRTTLAVVAVAALAVLIRVVELGGRVFHWDEGRVGYWILRYRATGEFYYRPIIHGPFLPIVNEYMFGLLGATDFSARLIVALVGGLLPLTALLFRTRLDSAETVGVALFLAANPLLVYYSRFMRSDVLVAGFALAALGFAVRGLDTGRTWPAFPAAAALALAFTAKENALIYLLCYLGAGALLLDHRLVRSARSGASVVETVRGWGNDLRRGARERSGGLGTELWGLLTLAGVTGCFLAVIVFFYAPRPEFGASFADPARFPGVFERATLGAAERFYETWAAGAHRGHDYFPYLFDLLETLAYGAPVLLAFVLLGFVADGYVGDRPRALVAFAAYWAGASLIGYPVATDIEAPWAAVHVVIPLALVAGVGLGFVWRELRRAVGAEDPDFVEAGLAALVVLSAVGGVAAANAAYWNTTDEADREVLQWAQPENDLQETLAKVRAVSRTNEGTDVLFYGTTNPATGDAEFYVEDESSLRTAPAGGPAWHSRLPLPWYLERYDANVTSTEPGTDPAALARDAPPVVIAYDWDREELATALDGYVAYEHASKLWGEHVVIFVDRSALRAADVPVERGGDAGGSATPNATARALPA